MAEQMSALDRSALLIAALEKTGCMFQSGAERIVTAAIVDAEVAAFARAEQAHLEDGRAEDVAERARLKTLLAAREAQLEHLWAENGATHG